MIRALLLTTLLLAAGALPACLGQDYAQEDAQGVEQGREALGGRTYFPFYDAQKDEIHRIDVKAKQDADNVDSNSKWEANTTAPTTGPTRLRSGFNIAPVLQVVGLTILALLIVGVIILLVKAFLLSEQSESTGKKFVDTARDVDRVEDLPFKLKRPTGDFLSEAQRLYEAGQFSEAIVYLFSYQLVSLDKRQVIRLAKGKTNRQYLRETRSRELLKQILQGTMISFEDVFFGHHELSKARFEVSWQRLDSFHRELEQVELTPA